MAGRKKAPVRAKAVSGTTATATRGTRTRTTRRTTPTVKRITVATVTATPDHDEHYSMLEKAITTNIATIQGPLFRTDATPEALWNAYLSGLPAHRRQHYTCNCCRRFIQSYGGLVTIDAQGMMTPAIWNVRVPSFFHASIEAIRKIILKSKVTGVYYSSETTWGTPKTGEWTHLCGYPSGSMIFIGKTMNADQKMAEKVEDYKMLTHAIADYPKSVVEQAVRILQADTLDRSEKTLGVAEWFNSLHQRVGSTNWRNSNLIWAAVATAPTGFCHIRSSMIGTLLDDIKSGLEYNAISRRWAEKMHPLQYQRPTAPPKEGTIKQAEKLIEQTGTARSLERRPATLNDILDKAWVPTPETPKTRGNGVFDHLRQNPSQAKEITLPTVTMTWEKFRRTVLPTATSMEILVPQHGTFCGLVTATHPDAPAILQWDGFDDVYPRNPVSWYIYSGGSYATAWNIHAGWRKVTCVFDAPHQWQDPSRFSHQVRHIHFAIEGCYDTSGHCGLALFPECLKAEFHGIRSVIEAHSNRSKATVTDGGNAHGMIFNNNSPVTIRVKTHSGTATYKLDRMD